tara:strand:- start:244 stop:354 length:111 start_codon:yes stop_codon:yes gene_type:complete
MSDFKLMLVCAAMGALGALVMSLLLLVVAIVVVYFL